MDLSPKQKSAIREFRQKHETMPTKSSTSNYDSVAPMSKKLTPDQIRRLNEKGAEIAAALKKNTV